jgi:mannose-6-phosphate isomerase-like protein (cupin superfamily)
MGGAGVSEKNYGVIADRLAWDVPLNPSATVELAPFQVFTAGAPEETEHDLRVRPLARSTALSLYVRAFADGGGEDGIHAHPDDAIWLVLEGHASFFGERGRPLGELGPHEGILVPALASYRFRCTGASLLARFGAGQP